MSTLDSGLEPPGDWQSPYPPAPGAPGEPGGGRTGGPTDATRKAATYTWLCAGLSLLASCCCVLMAMGLSALPPDEFMRKLPADMPNRDDIRQALPMLPMFMGVVGVLLMLIPAVVLGVLGFAVRSGNRGAMIASMIVLGIQGVALAALVLMNIVSTLISGSSGDLFGALLLLGVLAIIVKTMLALFTALKPNAHPGMPPVDPWGT